MTSEHCLLNFFQRFGQKWSSHGSQSAAVSVDSRRVVVGDVARPGSTMGPDVRWVLPKLRRPTMLWGAASSFTIAVVGLFAKVLAGCTSTKPGAFEWLNKATIYNKRYITDALDYRPAHVPLITISNHYSCFDDPGLWGNLPIRHICSKRRLRWSLAAHDICFTNIAHSIFFMLGKCIPVIRGKGVYQPAVDFCLEKLKEGSWVHIFPEGKVNMTKDNLRLKWGVGRLVYESPVTPIIIPIWHEGMDDILPNIEPYMFRFRKNLTINYGEPIDVKNIVDKLRSDNASPEEARKVITDHLQHKLYQLKENTLGMINKTSNGYKKEL